MSLIFKERGGGWIGFKFQGTWPFATIELYSNKLRLKIAWTEVEIMLSEITSVKRIFIFPVLADGVIIKHKNRNYPSFLIFWSLLRAGKIKKEISEAVLHFELRNSPTPAFSNHVKNPQSP